MNIIVASKDSARLIAALELALTSAALGQSPRLFLQGEAAGLILLPLRAPQDAAREAAGLPSLALILAETAAMEVPIIVCQSGLLLSGHSPDDIWPDAQMGGLISFLTGVTAGTSPIVY